MGGCQPTLISEPAVTGDIVVTVEGSTYERPLNSTGLVLLASETGACDSSVLLLVSADDLTLELPLRVASIEPQNPFVLQAEFSSPDNPALQVRRIGPEADESLAFWGGSGEVSYDEATGAYGIEWGRALASAGRAGDDRSVAGSILVDLVYEDSTPTNCLLTDESAGGWCTLVTAMGNDDTTCQ